MTTNTTSQEASAVICAGLFIIVTGDRAATHILAPDERTRFYEGTRFARAARDPETAMLNLVRSTFRDKEASFALPAHDYDQLKYLMDHYDGPAKEFVNALAASWRIGVPFQSFDDTDDGAHDRIPEAPIVPPAPAGSEQPQTIQAPLPQQAPPQESSLTIDNLLALASR